MRQLIASCEYICIIFSMKAVVLVTSLPFWFNRSQAAICCLQHTTWRISWDASRQAVDTNTSTLHDDFISGGNHRWFRWNQLHMKHTRVFLGLLHLMRRILSTERRERQVDSLINSITLRCCWEQRTPDDLCKLAKNWHPSVPTSERCSQVFCINRWEQLYQLKVDKRHPSTVPHSRKMKSFRLCNQSKSRWTPFTLHRYDLR